MVTAVISLKGGVGKTTTTVHLAAALAEAGRRVLLIDLDPHGSAGLSLGIGPGVLPFNGADVLFRRQPLELAIFPTSVERLDLVASAPDLRSADVELRGSHHVLRKALEPIQERYDHIFFDCAPSWNDLAKNALVASEHFLIPSTPHFLATKGIEHLAESAERVAWSAGHPSRFLGVVLTMVDYRIRSTRDRVADIRHSLGTKVFAVEIRTNISLAEAPAEGLTVFQFSPYATGAKAYQLLSEEYLAAVPRPEPALVY